MDSDNKRDSGMAAIRGDVAPGDSTTRARNRTVMLTPELTGTMRTRLGGQSTGEVFEANGVADRTMRELPHDWKSPVDFESSSTGDLLRLGEQEPSQETSPWDSSESAMDFEPESAGFMQPESDTPVTDNGFEAPVWDESVAEQPNDQRVISPARIVRAGSSSPVSKVGTLATESENPWSEAGVTNQTNLHEEEEPLAARPRPQSFETDVTDPLDFEPQIEAVRHEKIFWRNPSQLVGFLVSYDHEPLGSYVELRKGRLLVTSEGEVSGNCLVITHETVSPMHAIMRIAEGSSVQVLDQLSEHGTRITRGGSGQDAGENVLLSGDKASLRNGDILSFGGRSFHVCLVTTT